MDHHRRRPIGDHARIDYSDPSRMLTAFTAQPPIIIDPLFELELRIARRADELSAAQAVSTKGLNLNCWLHAEMEICRSMQLIPARASSDN